MNCVYCICDTSWTTAVYCGSQRYSALLKSLLFWGALGICKIEKNLTDMTVQHCQFFNLDDLLDIFSKVCLKTLHARIFHDGEKGGDYKEKLHLTVWLTLFLSACLYIHATYRTVCGVSTAKVRTWSWAEVGIVAFGFMDPTPTEVLAEINIELPHTTVFFIITGDWREG